MLTARDAYGNAVPSGDPGFTLAAPADAALVPGSFSRSHSAPATTFTFRIAAAAVYVMRFEDAAGQLVHQSKIRVKPGGVSWADSSYVSPAPSFTVGGTWLSTLRVQDRYGNSFTSLPDGTSFALSTTLPDGSAGPVRLRGLLRHSNCMRRLHIPLTQSPRKLEQSLGNASSAFQ